ncbi:alpha-lytic protease prodomain-containing protein [Streptomyces longwoodensis]|uniref:alpha-lytic protease prodomain-containing protein n=1 Tax=Streptomyces longwoodensis TaxID=68231 RepID=UPI0030E3DFB3|nr:alpha-lytic protease prodomain-containing protein [Streptomyces longwoodensis]
MAGRRRAVAHRAALAAVGTLALTALHPSASAEPAAPPHDRGPLPTAARTVGADAPSAEVLRAMQRDLRLTARQARTRLVNEAEAGTRAGVLHNALGKRFAGAWVKGATSADLTVATTDRADVPAIEAQGAKAVVVRWNLDELRAVQKKLDTAAQRVDAAATPVWYVDVRSNRVVVQATTRAAAAAFVEAAGAPGDHTAVRVSAQRPRLFADIVGGDAYYIDDLARCSIGFSITKSDEQGFVSAGHCGQAGSTTKGSDQTDQGVFQASTFPGEDMSWVSTNENWTATPYVKGDGGTLVPVEGSVEAVVGAAVCRSGSTTGWHCGTIQQRDTTVDYAEGTVNGLTQTDVCAEPGDSGGSYISGSEAQGVTSGGSGDCTSGGTTFFQPVNPILDAYGLTLRTTGETTAVPADNSGAADGWSTGKVYRVGTTVTHGQVRYRCLQTHQAQNAWAPDVTPALWQRL